MVDRVSHEHEAQNRMVEAAGLLRWAATELRAAGRESLAGELDEESDRIRDLMSRLSWDVELPPELEVVLCGDVEPETMADADPWRCTRTKGHGGEHMATVSGPTWPYEPPHFDEPDNETGESTEPPPTAAMARDADETR